MDRLAVLLSNIVDQAEFCLADRGRVDSAFVRELWDRRRFGESVRGDPELQRLHTFRDHLSADRIEIEATLLDCLVAELAPLLEKYIEPVGGKLGNGVFLLGGGDSRAMYPSIEQFGRMLAIAAVRIGPDRAGELFRSWLEGEPLRIQRHAIIDGVSILSPLDADQTMALSRMPEVSEEFPVSLPYHPSMPFESYAGKALLTVDFEAKPALYRPDPGEQAVQSWARQEIVPADRRLKEFCIGRFCNSLALVIDSYVDWLANWQNPGDVGAFMLTPSSRVRMKPSFDPRAGPIAQGHLDEAIALHGKTERKKQLDIAIARWVKSKRPGSVEDSLIELRVALEATYIKQRGELRFRTALHGAMHTGKTLSERRRAFRTIRAVYDDASRVMHGSELRDEAQSRKNLEAAQRICRRSILMIINEGRFPNWTELVLDGEVGTA